MASFFDPVMQTNTSLLVHFLFIFYVKAHDHDSDFLHSFLVVCKLVNLGQIFGVLCAVYSTPLPK